MADVYIKAQRAAAEEMGENQPKFLVASKLADSQIRTLILFGDNKIWTETMLC